jgi:predicted transcriptional regulator
MSDANAPTTELTSQYTAQVASDLERNAKEQERIGAEIEALQEQLSALQHDHTVLTHMQKALGTADTVTPSAPEETAASRPKTGTKSGAGKQARAKKTAPAQGGKTAKKSAAKTSGPTAKATTEKAAAEKAAQPTLVELIRRHLVDQGEPRSAAEIATTLDQLHDDRTIKTTVVRTTLENLVAKSLVQRTKQGSSVYYTATETPAPAAAAAAESPADAQSEKS